jgi:hypothetical protein
MVAGKGKCV